MTGEMHNANEILQALTAAARDLRRAATLALDEVMWTDEMRTLLLDTVAELRAEIERIEARWRHGRGTGLGRPR